MNLFNKTKGINQYLDTSTKKSLSTKIIELFGGTTNNFDELYEQLLVYLIEADLGVEISEKIIEQLKAEVSKELVTDKNAIIDKLVRIIIDNYHDTEMASNDFIMLVGVNGSGKTTTISKLANLYLSQGKTVGLIAADTFRAGAVAQLDNWAKRLNVPCVVGKENADPSSVLVDGARYFKENPVDIVIADTAGRLQNKANLMKELEKMVRVSKRELGKDDLQVWLVIDSTIGQNALSQAEAFLESSSLNGVILTKTDGTSKGGIVIAVNQKFKLPIRYITFGENIEAIKPFEITDYISKLIRG